MTTIYLAPRMKAFPAGVIVTPARERSKNPHSDRALQLHDVAAEGRLLDVECAGSGIEAAVICRGDSKAELTNIKRHLCELHGSEPKRPDVVDRQDIGVGESG